MSFKKVRFSDNSKIALKILSSNEISCTFVSIVFVFGDIVLFI